MHIGLPVNFFKRFKYAILSTIALILLIINSREPIPVGHAEDYWKFACGIEVEAFDGHFPYHFEFDTFTSRDEWYFYYYQEHHGRHVFKVRKDDLILEVAEVRTLLSQEITSTVQDKPRPSYIQKSNNKRLRCLDIDKRNPVDDSGFIDAIEQEVAKQSESFDIHWEKSKIFWMTVVFEMVFLPLWWLFSFHAGVFGRLNKKRTIRIAFSPILLFFPYFLGYSTDLSYHGSNSGSLYHLIAGLVNLPFSVLASLFNIHFPSLPIYEIDIFILDFLPKPLQAISHIPLDVMASSFAIYVSPIIVCGCTILTLMIGKILESFLIKKDRIH